ncbi:MAG: isochorismatase family protein [Pseudonocardia sp.]|nr:isochorismatase family protein [Pseudonocardia sp.]
MGKHGAGSARTPGTGGAERTAGDIARKVGLLDVLAGVIKMITHKPVVRVGHIAGQYGKPRSQPTERVGDVELPVYWGHMVNSPDPDPEGRRPDPWWLLAGYQAASEVMSHLGWHGPSRSLHAESPVWTSHEALLLDYEIPMLRPDGEGRFALTFTHWPWVGERTRQIDGAHVALLANVVNPVACKVGPRMQLAELLAICERLDPHREPGRLTAVPVIYTAQPGGMAKAQRGLFYRSDLLQQMRDEGRDQLVVCGVYAHVGVLMTAVEAFTNDIQTFLIADAITDFSVDHQQMAVSYTAARCAVVITLDEVFQ